MSSSSRGAVLRGAAAVAAAPARLQSDLRLGAPGWAPGRRPVDPHLQQAFTAAVAEAREQASEEGFNAGFADGLRAAEELSRARVEEESRRAETARAEAANRLARALGALDDVAAQLRAQAASRMELGADEVARAAFEVTRALLGRELAVASEPGLDAVRRALALAPQGRPVTVRLNPADHAMVADLPVGDAFGRECQLVPDPTVPPGGAVGEHASGRIDATIEAALERVRQVLAP